MNELVEFIVSVEPGLTEHYHADTVRIEAGGQLVLFEGKRIVVMFNVGAWHSIRTI